MVSYFKYTIETALIKKNTYYNILSPKSKQGMLKLTNSVPYYRRQAQQGTPSNRSIRNALAFSLLRCILTNVGVCETTFRLNLFHSDCFNVIECPNCHPTLKMQDLIYLDKQNLVVWDFFGNFVIQ